MEYDCRYRTERHGRSCVNVCSIYCGLNQFISWNLRFKKNKNKTTTTITAPKQLPALQMPLRRRMSSVRRLLRGRRPPLVVEWKGIAAGSFKLAMFTSGDER